MPPKPTSSETPPAWWPLRRPNPGPSHFSKATKRWLAFLPQPDRLVTVKAARVPLIEAARPLLEALARMPAQLDDQKQDDFYRALVVAITAFQSIAQDARIYDVDILASSYMLCAALDEAIAHTAWATANESTARHWAGRLSVQFHGANNGGDGFFLVLGRSAIEPARHIDLLELMLLILVLGFEGLYRGRHLGQQRLDDVRHKVYAMVYRERDAQPIAPMEGDRTTAEVASARRSPVNHCTERLVLMSGPTTAGCRR